MRQTFSLVWYERQIEDERLTEMSRKVKMIFVVFLHPTVGDSSREQHLMTHERCDSRQTQSLSRSGGGGGGGGGGIGGSSGGGGD